MATYKRKRRQYSKSNKKKTKNARRRNCRYCSQRKKGGAGFNIEKNLPNDTKGYLDTFMMGPDRRKLAEASTFADYNNNHQLLYLTPNQSMEYVQLPSTERKQFLKNVFGQRENHMHKKYHIEMPSRQVCLHFKHENFANGHIPMNNFSNCLRIYFYDCYFPTQETDDSCIHNVPFVHVHHCRRIDDCYFLSKLTRVTITQHSSLFASNLYKLQNVPWLTMSFCCFYLFYKPMGEHGYDFNYNGHHFNTDPTVMFMFSDNNDQTGFNAKINEAFLTISGHNKYLNLTYSKLPPEDFAVTNIEYLNLSNTCIESLGRLDNVGTVELTGCRRIRPPYINILRELFPNLVIIKNNDAREKCWDDDDSFIENQQLHYEQQLEETRNTENIRYDPVMYYNLNEYDHDDRTMRLQISHKLSYMIHTDKMDMIRNKDEIPDAF